MSEIAAYENRLQALFGKAQQFSDLELQAHWARYLCVLVSGYLEISVRYVVREYARTRAHENVNNYVSDSIEWFQNPKAEQILQLVGRFNSQWRVSLEAAIDGQLKDAVDSIVNNRHQISHGGQVGITLPRMSQYFRDAQAVVKELRKVCV
jgi:hypothetical protein